MQLASTEASTAVAGNVSGPMVKRREIPSGETPARSFTHAATIDEVEPVRSKVELLGVGWHDAVAEAGLSRNVGYTLLRGQGSIGSLRAVEKWAQSRESALHETSDANPRAAWANLGDELLALGEDQMGLIAEALREYISAEQRRRAAFSKLLGISRR